MDDIFEHLDDGGNFECEKAHNKPVERDMRGQLQTAGDCINFTLAGNATLTLVSKATKNRFTFKISKVKEQTSSVSHFVALLNGPNNEDDYQYLGQMRATAGGVRFEHGRKSKVSGDAISVKAFTWYWQHVNQNRLPEALEVWHEGRCCRCNRKLTVPESIARGIGPECASKTL